MGGVMIYTTADGEKVELIVGDMVYIDEGDSVDDQEWTGTVVTVESDYFVLLPDGRGKLKRRIHPDRVVDIQITQ